jgi:hypothetical protein
MDKLELEIFRLKFRMLTIEKIAISASLLMPVIAGQMSLAQSHAASRANLEATRAKAMAVYGGHLQDPALADLYASEVSELIDSLAALLDRAAEKALDRG